MNLRIGGKSRFCNGVYQSTIGGIGHQTVFCAHIDRNFIYQGAAIMKYVWIILLCPTLICLSGISQSPDISASICFYGDWIVHPGVIVGLSAEFDNGWGVELNAGGSVHPDYQWTIFILPGIRYKFDFLPHWKPDLFISPGFALQYPAAPNGVYNGSNDMAIKTKETPHYLFFPWLGLGILNWEFPTGEGTTGIIGRIIINGEYPYNQMIHPNLGLELGVGYEF